MTSEGKNRQKPTVSADYMPSKIEQRLLEILLDPASRMKSIAAICRDAKINRDTYYEIFKRQGFCKLYRESARAVILQNVAPMINSLVKEACRGSAPHLKMGLEIADVYTEKHDVVTETYAERMSRLIEREQEIKY